MKTIKIFLASSEELEDDRNAFGNLVRKLNKVYEKRGIKLDVFEWEDDDAAYNDRRKQDEYNDKVRVSDMFLVVFHTKAGRFTIEEFDVAIDEFRKRGLPKSYVYCKDLKEGEIESEELKEFKRRLFKEMGHYWSRYSNRDTFQLHFVMQLQLVENSDNVLRVENGNIELDGHTIARMGNLPFAGLNEDFQKMNARLIELPKKIEKISAKIAKYPDDEDYKDDLQVLQNEYNKLKEDFAKYQNNLFSTAKRIAQLQGKRITDRMRRAMDAFNIGKVREANIILDEAERDGEIALQEYRQCRDLVEQKRQNVKNAIEEIVFKASILMADISIDIDDRIGKVEKLYIQADEMASECDYEAEKYDALLWEYAVFLDDYAKYEKALEVYKRVIQIRESLYGLEHPNSARAYSGIGIVYCNLGDFVKAKEYHLRALEIRGKVLGQEHPNTARSYNNIGNVYSDLGDNDKSLEYLFRALDIREKVLGLEHPDIARSYSSIGVVYRAIGDYEKALEYYFKSLEIRKKVLGLKHPNTGRTYNNIGNIYSELGDNEKALEYYFKALEISEKVLGLKHPDTASSYNNIGVVYRAIGDYEKALEYYFKDLNISEKVLGLKHPDTASLYNNIGSVYYYRCDYYKSLEYYFKALEIREKVLRKKHPDTASSYNNIGVVYRAIGDYEKALEYYFKALEIREKVLGKKHPDTASSYNNIGNVYYNLRDYAKALEYYLNTLEIRKKALGLEHPDTICSIKNISKVKKILQQSL